MVTLTCNESNAVYLPAVLEASLAVELAALSPPSALLTTVLEKLVYELPPSTGLVLDGQLLSLAVERFLETRQSLRDLSLLVSASAARHLMEQKTAKEPALQLDTYFAALDLFCLFAAPASKKPSPVFALSGAKAQQLGFHIEIQRDQNFLPVALKE